MRLASGRTDGKLVDVCALGSNVAICTCQRTLQSALVVGTSMKGSRSQVQRKQHEAEARRRQLSQTASSTMSSFSKPAAVYVDDHGRLQLRGYPGLLTRDIVQRSELLSEIVNNFDQQALTDLPVGDSDMSAWITAIVIKDKSLSTLSATRLAQTLMVRQQRPSALLQRLWYKWP